MGKYMRIGRRAFIDYPRNLTKLTQKQYEDVVKFYSKLPLKEIRRRQDINEQYLKMAYERKDDELSINQQIIGQQLMDAIQLKEFGEEPGDRTEFLKKYKTDSNGNGHYKYQCVAEDYCREIYQVFDSIQEFYEEMRLVHGVTPRLSSPSDGNLYDYDGNMVLKRIKASDDDSDGHSSEWYDYAEELVLGVISRAKKELNEDITYERLRKLLWHYHSERPHPKTLNMILDHLISKNKIRLVDNTYQIVV